jgi:folylpolyglutamate synthase
MRDVKPLIQALFKAITESLDSSKPFTHVIFTTNVTYSDKNYSPDLVASLGVDPKEIDEMKVQQELAKVWRELDPDAFTTVTRSIQDAIQSARGIAKSFSDSSQDVMVLITGSLHLVGGAIEILESDAGK